MTTVPGTPEPLDAWLAQRGRLELDLALELAAEIALEVRSCHLAGRYLGVVAPPGILVADGHVRSVLPVAPREVPPAWTEHVAPEHRTGEPLGDAAGDLFGVGRVLFLLVTGEPPQPGDVPSQWIDGACALDRAFAGCHARRERRYPSVDALIQDVLPALPPSGQVSAKALAAALAPTGSGTPAPGHTVRAAARALQLERKAPPPPSTEVARLDALLVALEAELDGATARVRMLSTVGGLVATAACVWAASWPGLLAFPVALLFRMVHGDVRQKAWFFAHGLPRLEAFCAERDVAPLFVWQHVAAHADRFKGTWTWMGYAEEHFLPEPLRTPPPRMGGVSRVPNP